MKKFLCILLAICFVFLLAACGGRPERENTTGGDTEQTEKDPEGEKDPDVEDETSNEGEIVQLSAQMFENARVELDGAENIGIIVEEEEDPELTGTTTERSYIVSFNEDGTFDKITFLFTSTDEYSDGTYRVTQEQIEGNPIKLYVTDTFIFLAYRTGMMSDYEKEDPDYEITYNSSDENFVIDRATGKLFSLKELTRFRVVSNSVVEYSNPASNYYRLSVEDGALTVTDLLPNKNIEARFVVEDKFGNCYVQTDSYEGKEGNVVYGMNLFYTGNDGYVYEMTEDIVMAYSLGNTYLLRRYGSDGNVEQNWSADTIIRFYSWRDIADTAAYIMLMGNEVYVFRPDSGDLYYFWYGERTDAGTVVSKEYLWYMDGAVPVAPGMIAAYATYGTGQSDQIWYYDMTEKYIDDRVESRNQGYICDRGILYTEGNKAFVRMEEAMGTTIYELVLTTGEDGDPSVEAKLYLEIVYQAEVVTIQPLN